MAKFFITMTRQITVQAQIEVEATTEEEAKEKALEMVEVDDRRTHKIDWETHRISWLKATDPQITRAVKLD